MACCVANTTKKWAIPTRYIRRTNFDRPQLLAINKILNAASEMNDSQDPSAPIALFESFGDEDPGGAKFLLEECMSFIGIGGIVV